MGISISEASGVATAYRDGDVLVVPLGSSLPASCVKCGAPSAVFVSKTFRCSPLFIPLLRRKARIDVPFCLVHYSWRTKMSIASTVLLLGFFGIPAVLGLLAGLLGRLLGRPLEVGPVFAEAVLVIMLLSGITAVMIGGGPLRPIHIDKSFAKFRGASEKLLQQLPTRADSH